MNFAPPPIETGTRGFRPDRCAARRLASFTLTEMLVSIAILSILSVLLIGILNQVTAGWSQVQAQIDTRQNARSMLTLMASDLRVAAIPKDRSNYENLQFVVDPTSLPTSYNCGQSVFFQAPIATTTTYGNLAEVGYFVQWDSTVASNPKALLCRFFINPTQPKTAGTAGNYLIYYSPSAWLTSAIITSVAPGTSSGTPAYAGWAADNVIGLWIRCLDASGIPITKNASGSYFNASDYYAFDSRQGYTTASGLANLGVSDTTPSTGTATKTGNALPTYVDIAVAVVDARTALKITTIPTYTSTGPTNFWADINTFTTALPTAVKSGTRVYSTRVQLINGY